MEKNFYILQIEENEELAIQIEKMIMETGEWTYLIHLLVV